MANYNSIMLKKKNIELEICLNRHEKFSFVNSVFKKSKIYWVKRIEGYLSKLKRRVSMYTSLLFSPEFL